MIFKNTLFGTVVTPGNELSLRSQSKEKMAGLLEKHGTILLRGFDCNRQDFLAFSECLSDHFFDYKHSIIARETHDGDETLMSVPGGASSKGGNKAIRLHGEMHYQHPKNRPDTLFFYCMTPPIKQGMTTVCPGGDLFDSLSKKTQQLFLENDITYELTYEKSRWKGIFRTEAIEEIRRIVEGGDRLFTQKSPKRITASFTTPAVVANHLKKPVFVNSILLFYRLIPNHIVSVRLSGNKRIPLLVYREIMHAAKRLTVKIPWQRGDLVIVDNTTVMHGRTRICDFQRDILVRLAKTSFF